jgi:hypothetical protein
VEVNFDDGTSYNSEHIFDSFENHLKLFESKYEQQ